MPRCTFWRTYAASNSKTANAMCLPNTNRELHFAWAISLTMTLNLYYPQPTRPCRVVHENFKAMRKIATPHLFVPMRCVHALVRRFWRVLNNVVNNTPTTAHSCKLQYGSSCLHPECQERSFELWTTQMPKKFGLLLVLLSLLWLHERDVQPITTIAPRLN